jgi:hypothetical protein
MKITALLAAGALALCAAPTTEARLGRHGRSLRWGGWNGAAAQAAAMAISGFSGGQLNGPSSGGYNPGYSNYNAPIVRPYRDEDDDDLGGQSFSVSGGVSGQSGGTNYNANFGYKNEWDEDDDQALTNYAAQYLKRCTRSCDFMQNHDILRLYLNRYNCKANCVKKAGQLTNRL